MQRWERTRDGVTDVWEVERAAELITERAGRMGVGLVTRTARCDTEAMAEGIAARMAAQRERQGYARVDAGAAAPTAEAPRPTYPGLDDKALGAVIRAVAKNAARDAYAFGEALMKATGDWNARYPLAWFLLAHRLVPAETMPGFWDLLAEDHAHVDPAAVLGLIARVPEGAAFAKLFKHGPMAWFVAGSSRSLDELLFAAYQRDPALCEARAAALPAAGQRALDFVRGRSGAPVDPARARALLTGIAAAQTRHGLATNWDLARVDDGVVTRPRLADTAAVRAVALRFGTAAEWDAAMVAAALGAKELSIYNVRDALRACTAVELATLLARARSFGTNEELARQLHLLEVERDDDPAALLAAAETLRDGDTHAKTVSEMLAVVAAARFAAQGRPVPEALAGLLGFAFLSGVYHESIAPYVRGLRALPRATVHALVERALAEPYAYARGLGALLAWSDDALLARFFDRDATNVYLEPEVVGRFGAAALPHLARVWDATPRDRRRSRHQQVLAALANAADRGEAIDPAWDAYLVFDEEGGEALKYWDPSYARLRERALRGLPPDRRLAALLRCVADRRYPERALASAHVLDDAGLAAVAAAFLPRRARSERSAVVSALRALGDRAVAALAPNAAAFAGDADFVAVMREALSPAQVDAIVAG